eukprot:GHVU01026272.1.p2 GENE.GHVU01026272.1~~GHVU01026272.1.p2  ORF type:complete len:225 (+),score=38.51 GHVU01026272.1:557-1231(+)
MDVIFSESAAKGQRLGTGPTWIIDPIDGTTNFFHGYPYCGVSIAFASGGEVLVGCVHCPQMNQTFWGCKGRGSYLNGERLATSGVTDIGDSLVSTGFSVVNLQRLNDPNTSEAMKPQLQKYKEVVMYNAEQLVMRCQDIRRFGAIAVDLCQIAAGRIDAACEMCPKEWDMAAGMLIVQEAGGHVCDFDGTHPLPLHKRRCLAASTKELATAIGSVVKVAELEDA